MIQFNRPEKLNGEQLINELQVAGVTVLNYPVIDGNGNFFLDVADSDKKITEEIVNSHVGIDNSTLKSEARQKILDRLGLTAEELKVLLG